MHCWHVKLLLGGVPWGTSLLGDGGSRWLSPVRLSLPRPHDNGPRSHLGDHNVLAHGAVTVPRHCAVGGACKARVWALTRIGVVHPLCKEVAMQRHDTAMERCDIIKLLDHLLRELPRSQDRPGGKHLHKRHDVCWLRFVGHEVLLQVTHQLLALVEAADEEEARRGHAIALRIDVVGHEHFRLIHLGFLQDALLAQVGRALAELPGPCEEAGVEA
mmetsp:Transcript_2965/g.6502  ORF Transcript_2965/g.6502 Transcript_2965/m.6502 type:complete len:216 (-) Transcript_2965:554-1201(-)